MIQELLNKHEMQAGDLREDVIVYTRNMVEIFLVQQRQQILEAVEKMRKECPNHNQAGFEERVECYGYDEMHNEVIDGVIDLIKSP